jgi:hypothetical protein
MVSTIFGEVPEDVVVSMVFDLTVVSVVRSFCPPSSGLALFGARPLHT